MSDNPDVSVVQFKDLEEDLKEFLLRAQRRSYRFNIRQVREYKSPMISERSVFNRVPLDGGAVLNIYDSRDKTFDLIKRLMRLVMCQEVLVTLRNYVDECNLLEVRLQSLIYHIAQCPQYDLEIIDIKTKLDEMNKIVTKLEAEYVNETGNENSLLAKYGLLQITENWAREGGEGEEEEEEEDVRYEDDEEAH